MAHIQTDISSLSSDEFWRRMEAKERALDEDDEDEDFSSDSSSEEELKNSTEYLPICIGTDDLAFT